MLKFCSMLLEKRNGSNGYDAHDAQEMAGGSAVRGRPWDSEARDPPARPKS